MIRLIPAIDIIQGQCVRLSKGDYDTKRVYGNPVEIAQQMEALGFRRLHLVDLDGAKEGHVVNLQVLRDICQKTNLIIDFGGGVKTEKDVELVLETGAKMITVGSMAVKSPSTLLKWIETYGAEHLILGADVRDGRISISTTTSAQVSIYDANGQKIMHGNGRCFDLGHLAPGLYLVEVVESMGQRHLERIMKR